MNMRQMGKGAPTGLLFDTTLRKDTYKRREKQDSN